LLFFSRRNQHVVVVVLHAFKTCPLLAPEWEKKKMRRIKEMKMKKMKEMKR
jgi:hypothetical protein